MAALTIGRAAGLSARPLRINCYGDSLTAGFTADGFHPYARALQASLKAQGVHALVNPTGMSGWTAESLADAGDQPHGLNFILRTDPTDVAIILAGTNDLGYPSSSPTRAKEIVDNVWRIHNFAHTKKVHTIAVSVPESAYQARVTSAHTLRGQINDLLSDRCKESPDLCTYFECPVHWNEGSDLWESDGLHFSAAGYDTFGKSLTPVVMRVISRHPAMISE